MAKFSLRKYDDQARASLLLSVFSIVSLLGLCGLLIRNINWSEGVIAYGSRGKYQMIVLLAMGVTGLLALSGCYLGATSAGQRRNDKSTWSWLAFFTGAGVLCLTAILFFFFRFRAESVG